MILFLHNRYRTTGGEERAVEDLMWLVREHLGEETELLERGSGRLSRGRAAAGLLAGGLAPDEVASAVRRTRARVLHAHNLHPTLGWRALAAARRAGARVVLHLHQYRLVCAVGVCFTRGQDCTRCHGRNTLPGLALNCRGSAAEALAYGAGLALWQRRLAACVDAFVVPSHFALTRLTELGAPVASAHVVGHVVRSIAAEPAPGGGGYALVAGRLAPEKGVEVAIAACRLAGLPLVVAGDGPLRATLERHARAGERDSVRFTGPLDAAGLARLRREAAVALVPSRFAETFGLAAAEAMGAGLPVAASRIGALPELVPETGLAAPGDARALAQAITRLLRARPEAGAEALARVRATAAPAAIAPALRAVYDGST
ncbi:MAG TPA: glycosyltransferase [Solirubrobacteraceae bacterium]|nr:glycosyltransferase [Solirubrobacteraceae bacterium]